MRLKVEPDVVALAPGDVTDLLVRVHNDGEDACTPYLQVRGVDPDDVLLPDEVVAVPAGSVMTAVVRVRAAADAVPGDQRIAIAAEDLDGAQGTVSATTVLRIGARPDVAVEVDPVATVGRRGAKARTILRNRSDRRLQVDLEGRGEGVRVSFRPSRVTLDPGETKRVPTRMRRAQRSWFGEIRHGAVITARGIGAPASTTATFTQKPSVPRPAVRGVAALTALAVWVAATVVVFNRINAEPDAGPDSGVVAAPAAPGPGRTSATGMFEEETEDGVRLPVVIQGTIEGPRDPAGTTVTAERIGFGDQGTTTGLTKVVALAEVKLPRGNVLDVVRTTTDERGRFRIASGLVEEAFYRVTAVRAGFEVGSFIVSTSSDQPEVTIAIALEPATGSLAGTVTDTAGDPVGGATVVVTDGSAEYTTVTPSEGDGVGTWVLEGLATPATYQVLVSRRGFAAQTLIVELDGGQALRGVDAVLTADLGTIVGRVTDASPDPNQPGVAQGVGALTVTLAGPEPRETRTLTVAGDLRGTFDLPGLPYGDYTITFAGDGWETRQAELTVDRGLVRLDATINRSTGLVQGWVWQVATTDEAPQDGCRFPRAGQRSDPALARFRPCGGVAVTVSSDDGDVFATASANGTGFFQLGGVPAGEYTLTLSRSGYLSHVQSITVDPGQTFNLNPLRTASVVAEGVAAAGVDFIGLGLGPPPSVCSGTVVLTLIDFRDGQGIPPVADASFVPSLPDVISVAGANCGDTSPRATRIGTSGSYRIDNVPLGLQTITVGGAAVADRWPYVAREVDVQVSAAEASAVSLNILPNPRPLTLPVGAIAMTGADRIVFLQALNAADSVVGSGPPDGILIKAGGSNTDAIVLDLVSPDRNLRLRAVGPGYRTVTSAEFELEPGLGAFGLPLLPGPAPRLTVVATVDVTFAVSETIVVAGDESGSPAPVAGATVTAVAVSQTVTGTTHGDGSVMLVLDAGVAYTVTVAKAGYTDLVQTVTPGTGTELAESAPPITLLPTSGKLRLIGQVSESVVSVRVVGSDTHSVDVVGGSYVIDQLPTSEVLRVDFLGTAVGGVQPVLVSRWIQPAATGNFTIELDQDAEVDDLGSITVAVVVPEAPSGSGASTPESVSIRLIENVPTGFFSIGATGTRIATSTTFTSAGGVRTFSVVFDGLAKHTSTTALPPNRFTVAIDGTDGLANDSESLLPPGYQAAASSFSPLEVSPVAATAATFTLFTKPGSPTDVEATSPDDESFLVSWTQPANGGSEILSYAVTSAPAGLVCEPSPLTDTKCTVTSGIVRGTDYTFTVTATNAVGTSTSSAASDPVSLPVVVFAFTTQGEVGVDGPETATYGFGGVDVSPRGRQVWTVPTSGTYEIVATGAQGGSNKTHSGGNGAVVTARFSLTANEQIAILVGQTGQNLPSGATSVCNTGGGGGTFVWRTSSEDLLVAAGGGGGAGASNPGANASTDSGATAAPGENTSNQTSNVAAGWAADGGNDAGSSNQPGVARSPLSVTNPGQGGSAGTTSTGFGGFGGGAGGTGDNCSNWGAGGGGGFAGGPSQRGNGSGGGGGGSFVGAGGTDATFVDSNTTHGSVTITRIGG